MIYIPLCFYLYFAFAFKKEPAASFTFHYASTYTLAGSCGCSFFFIYIPLCFYLYWDRVEQSDCRKVFTFHYASTYTGRLNSWQNFQFRFTFHYASTYTGNYLLVNDNANVFTFHYASTYTIAGKSYPMSFSLFTFHYASTYTSTKSYILAKSLYLHSTMLLLIPKTRKNTCITPGHLHSTMLLLIPDLPRLFRAWYEFTFHYASTYTKFDNAAIQGVLNLHSTMLLLIRLTTPRVDANISDLHSTMLLLIRLIGRYLQVIFLIYIPLCFYLYLFLDSLMCSISSFTFHYASTYTE